MKKIVIVIFAIILIALIWIVFFSQPTCLDGGRTMYFEKKYLPDKNLQNFDAQKAPYIAYENFNLSLCKQEYWIRENNQLKESSEVEFSKFVKKYNEDCGNCLLVQNFSFGINRIYDFATGKGICNIDKNFTENCIELKED